MGGVVRRPASDAPHPFPANQAMTPVSPAQFCLLAGIALVVAEFAVPGVMICFFGAAALVLAGVYAAFPGLPFAAALALYIALSLAMVFGLRRFLPKTFKGRSSVEAGDPDDDDVAGSLVRVAEAISPDVPGKVEFRGTLWTAAADEPVAAGEIVEILRRENLTLRVRKAAKT